MQRELHPAVHGHGWDRGRRRRRPADDDSASKNLLLAAADSVAIDATRGAVCMGCRPLSRFPFFAWARARSGIADPRQIELVGDDVVAGELWIPTRRSLVIGATR